MSTRKKYTPQYPECLIVCEESDSEVGMDMFIVFDGVKIARRGYPDTPQARTWVSLELGFEVLDGKPLAAGGGQVVILCDGKPVLQ